MAGPLLPHNEILRLHKAAVDMGAAGHRALLLGGLPRAFTDRLPVAPDPSTQLLQDLNELNSIAEIEGGTVPLLLWLDNALHLAEGQGRGEAAVFRQALALLGKPPAPSALSPLPAPTPPLTRCELVLFKAGDGLSAMWQGGGGMPFPFKNPLTKEEMAEHRWYLEEYLVFPGPGPRARAKAFEERLDRFGEELYQALLGGRGAPDKLRELMTTREPRRLELVLTSEDADALALPWELLRDERGPLVFRDLVLRRQVPHADRAPAAAGSAGLPLRVLLVVARPVDVGFLDPRSSVRPMLDALDQLGGQVRLDFCDPPTLAELDARLDRARRKGEPYHIVHFDGHGVYLPTTKVGALCFEGADAKKHLVSGPDLGALLSRMQVPVAVLEACHSADLSSVVFGAVAPALLRSGVGSVIAFSHAVLVSAARILVEHFYKALCLGDSVGEALNAGRRALLANPVRLKLPKGEELTLRDWHIAELYQVSEDPVLVPGGAPPSGERGAPLQRGRPPSRDFVGAPMYGFHGRERELLALARKLRTHGAVALTGMGGMGKTSLAREAAHWWHRLGLRPGGAAFFSFETRQGADRTVLAFVRYLEGDRFVQRSPEALWDEAIRRFRAEPMLWVWDNFESTLPQYQDREEAGLGFPEEERDRLRRLFGELTEESSGKPKGWLLVTCRPEGTGLPGIAEIGLGGLASSAALDMAKKILDKMNVPLGSAGYDREALEELLKALEGHPLSIELVMPHLKTIKPAEATRELRKLIETATRNAAEGRNRSLMASLAFSTERLSDKARGVLPYLAWFDGGALEDVIVDFCELSPESWAEVRAELLGTALVRVDDEVSYGDKPYLHFHPTLPYAAKPEAVPDKDKAEERFLAIYRQVRGAVNKALQGAQPAGGMAVMDREEGNLRQAAAMAFKRGAFKTGAWLADTIGLYLNRAGRVRDQARLAAWTQEHMAEATGPARWAVERDHAWGLFLAGKAGEAVALLERQLKAIEEAGSDARQRALCQGYLGRILVHAGHPQDALDPLAKAIQGFEAEGDLANLSAALGSQANALRRLGQLDEALTSAERGVAIHREQGKVRNEAAGLGQMAGILMDQHRHADAERRYGEALKAARRAGDKGLEGSILQHLGGLAGFQGNHAHAVERYEEALARFQAVEDKAAEMRTADLLGSAEEDLGHHDAARAWYAEAERLASELGDERQLAVTAQNLGVLLQSQALALPEEAEDERRRLLGEARASVAKSLSLKRKRGDEVGAASSLAQLGVIHLELGELDEAERNMLEALAIHERLNLPVVWKDYANLEAIAEARGQAAEAAAWRAKKEAKRAELKRLARGDRPPRLPPGLRKPLLALCQVVYGSRSQGQRVPPDAAEVLTNLAAQPEPVGGIGRFLQRIEAGERPPVPEGLPEDFAKMLEALAEAMGRLAP